MRICQRFFIFFCLVFLFGGCVQQATIEQLAPKEEAAIAKSLLSQLASKDYAAIERQLDPSLKGASVRGALEQAAGFFPKERQESVTTVGSNTVSVNGKTTYSLTFEHQYQNSWLLSNVVLQRREGQIWILGLHVKPMKQSLLEANRFTFQGKGLLHYIVFALVVAVPVFIIYALVLCIRTPIAKRKWLWLLFVALGIVQLSLNWTDGSYSIQPISFAFLGAGFFRASPYAPCIFNVALPLGAIVFLLRRRALLAKRVG